MKNNIKDIAKATGQKISEFWGTKRGKIIITTGGTILTAAVITTVVLLNANSGTATQAQAAIASDTSKASSAISSEASKVSSSSAASSTPSSSSSAASKPQNNQSSNNVSSPNKNPTAASYAGTSGTHKTHKTTPSYKGTNQGSGDGGTQYSGGTGGTGGSGGGGNGGSGSNGGNGGGNGGQQANYQGVNETRTYSDEITGVTQTIRFGGVGAGHCEVAIGDASLNTSTSMALAHRGEATASLKGTNGKSTTADTGVTASGNSFTIGDLTAGNYTIQLTAHDGTVVARYHFSVDSNGNVN